MTRATKGDDMIGTEGGGAGTDGIIGVSSKAGLWTKERNSRRKKILF